MEAGLASLLSFCLLVLQLFFQPTTSGHFCGSTSELFAIWSFLDVPFLKVDQLGLGSQPEWPKLLPAEGDWAGSEAGVPALAERSGLQEEAGPEGTHAGTAGRDAGQNSGLPTRMGISVSLGHRYD